MVFKDDDKIVDQTHDEEKIERYSVMQSDGNSWKIDTFREAITSEPKMYINNMCAICWSDICIMNF